MKNRKKHPPRLAPSAAAQVSNLCRGRPKPRLEELRPAVPVITEKLRNSAWECLGCYSYGPKYQS